MSTTAEVPAAMSALLWGGAGAGWLLLRERVSARAAVGLCLLMVALPLILIGALQLGASEEAAENNRINLVDVATSSGLNFTLFVLFATTSFFLVVVYALFFGDTVASEAQWGSLRYTLATPVPRMRLLRQKFYAALVLSVGALVTLATVASTSSAPTDCTSAASHFWRSSRIRGTGVASV